MHENRINQVIIFSKIIFINTVIDVITTILAIMYGTARQSVNFESTTHRSVCQKHQTRP